VEMWRGKRTGAVLGFVQIIVAIIADLLFLSPGAAPSYVQAFYAVIGVNLILALMIVAIWRSLR
jgi:hypothetical protein